MPAQILTTDDLKEFKKELLECLSNMFEDLKSQKERKEKRWLKSGAVREILQCSSAKLQGLRVKGAIPYTKVGGVLYYDSKDVERIYEINKKQEIQG